MTTVMPRTSTIMTTMMTTVGCQEKLMLFQMTKTYVNSASWIALYAIARIIMGAS
jgi:hypothetical protein